LRFEFETESFVELRISLIQCGTCGTTPKINVIKMLDTMSLSHGPKLKAPTSCLRLTNRIDTSFIV